MNIKEIALNVADSLRNKVDGISHMQSNQGLARFAEALIESYKAELLHEAGEPVAEYRTYTGNGEFCPPFNQVMLNSWVTPPVGTKFFTSDQVASAILKATGPLEDRLATMQEEMNVWRNQAHQSQSACDRLQDQLTKAEQLWQVAQGRCDGLEEKLAKAEQRVAEACAYLAHQHMDADIAADAINNGEWRKFLKEGE